MDEGAPGWRLDRPAATERGLTDDGIERCIGRKTAKGLPGIWRGDHEQGNNDAQMIRDLRGVCQFKWELHGSGPSDIDKYLQKKQGAIRPDPQEVMTHDVLKSLTLLFVRVGDLIKPN